jgi:hypothetical protein
MKKRMVSLLFLASLFVLCLNCSTGEMPDKGIVILSPKANDVVPTGSSYEIQWKVEASDKNLLGEMLTVEFSKDGGKSWQQVEENVPKDGKYAWKVAKIESSQCKIRIFSQRSADFRGTSGVFTVK